MKTTQVELREFLYLDTAKVQSFSAVIQGGLAVEVSQKIKDLGEISGGLNLGVLQVNANVGGSKGRESERQQTLKITDTVLFDGVYRALADDDKLVEVKDSVVEARRRLNIRTFVKVEGTASPPVLEGDMDLTWTRPHEPSINRSCFF